MSDEKKSVWESIHVVYKSLAALGLVFVIGWGTKGYAEAMFHDAVAKQVEAEMSIRIAGLEQTVRNAQQAAEKATRAAQEAKEAIKEQKQENREARRESTRRTRSINDKLDQLLIRKATN